MTEIPPIGVTLKKMIEIPPQFIPKIENPPQFIPKIEIEEKSLPLIDERKSKVEKTKLKEIEKKMAEKIEMDSISDGKYSSALDSESIISSYSTSKYESQIDSPLSGFDDAPESRMFNDISSYIFSDDASVLSSSVDKNHSISFLSKSNDDEQGKLMNKKNHPIKQIKQSSDRKNEPKKDSNHRPVIKKKLPIMDPPLQRDSLRMCKTKFSKWRKPDESINKK